MITAKQYEKDFIFLQEEVALGHIETDGAPEWYEMLAEELRENIEVCMNMKEKLEGNNATNEKRGLTRKENQYRALQVVLDNIRNRVFAEITSEPQVLEFEVFPAGDGFKKIGDSSMKDIEWDEEEYNRIGWTLDIARLLDEKFVPKNHYFQSALSERNRPPYSVIVFPSYKRAVFVCNSYWNATYICDESLWNEYAQGRKVEDLRKASKEWKGNSKLPYVNYFNMTQDEISWRERLVVELEREIIEMEDKIEEIPKGWMTVAMLRKDWSHGWNIIKRTAEIYRKDYPKWFKKRMKQGNVTDFFSPELVEKLWHDLAMDEIPEGWMTAKSLVEDLRSSAPNIKKCAEIYRGKYPKWFRTGRLPGGKAEFYSPELVEKLWHDLAMDEIPEGWMTAKSLVEDLRSSAPNIKKCAETYREKYPKWFRIGRMPGGKAEFYSPELVKKLIGDFSDDKEEEGWMTVSQISQELGSAHKTISRRVEKCKKDHSKWFENGRRWGSIVEFCSPEFVEKLWHDLAIEEIPERWMNAKGLEKSLCTDHGTIKKRAERYRGKSPEWFKKGKSGSRRVEFYSPDLIMKVKEDLKSKGKKKS